MLKRKRWLELSVQAHPEAAESVSALLHKWGEGGVAIYQDYAQPDPEAPPQAAPGPITLATYVPEDASLEARRQGLRQDLWHLQAFHGHLVGDLQERWVAEQDWATAWKKHYHVLHIGKRLVIKPRWQPYQGKPGEVVVELDPGMAFGTGTHPTTQLCLEALEALDLAGKRVLDVGTGSGILALAAAALGASRVDALDLDPVAVRAARDNLRKAGLAGKVRVAQGTLPWEHRTVRYHVVVANIIASVLIGLAPEFPPALAPGGLLLASGIIQEKESTVLEAFQSAGLTFQHRAQAGDWVLLMMEHPV
jgi:ribosomal protein L11 methyltransferase